MDDRKLQQIAAEEVRVRMARRAWKANRLAAEAAMTPQTLGRKLKSNGAFDLDELERIAAALGLSPEELLIRSKCFALCLAV